MTKLADTIDGAVPVSAAVASETDELLSHASSLHAAAERLSRAAAGQVEVEAITASLNSISAAMEQLAGGGLQLALTLRAATQDRPGDAEDGESDTDAATRLLSFTSQSLRMAAEATRTASVLTAPAPADERRQQPGTLPPN